MYVDSKQVPDTPRTEESSRYDDDSLMEDLFGHDDIQQPQDMLENDTDTPIAQALNEPEHVYDPTPRQTMFGTSPANSKPRESIASESLDSRRSAQLPTSMTFLDRGSLMERGGIPLLREWPKRTSSMRRRSRDVLSLMERGALTQSQAWDQNEAENTNGSAAPSARNSHSWLSTRNSSFRRRNMSRQHPRDSRTISTTAVRDREQPSNAPDRFSTATRDSHEFSSVQRNTRFWNSRESRAGDTGSTVIPPSQRGTIVDNGNGPRSSQFRHSRPFSSFRDRDSRASGVRDSYTSFNGSNSNLPARSAETPPPLPPTTPALQRLGYNSAAIRRSNSHAGDYGRDRGSVSPVDSEHDLYRLSQNTGCGDELEAVTEYENEDEGGQYKQDIAAAASVSAEAQRQRRNQVVAHQRELYRQYMRSHRQRWSQQQQQQQPWDDNSVLEEEEDEDEDDGRTIRLSTPREEDEDEDEDAATASAVPTNDAGTTTEVPDEGEPGSRESVMSQGESVLMYYAEEKDGEESELEDDNFPSEDDLYSGRGYGDYDERGFSNFYVG
ncbi:hypothetical protein IWZ03DRAFT_383155 [Phyllosticta citriasiana]|uniref:Uncharacterized protein n=1 Tax=Phyllosticta citriasiana TaxID=595635 RepID=A0ABR1KHB4_9PEZI